MEEEAAGDAGGDEYGRVRVWWEPTDNRERSGFAGAWWPAKVLARNKNKLRVKYDNGEEDDVLINHVSPLDTLPVAFGEEEEELAPGEFCEVFNGSKTDPCAWLGRIVRFTKSSQIYMVEYPFHDAKAERIESKRIRRARVMEDGEWRLIKPKQMWEDGDVTSPNELELIHEDDLFDFIDEASQGAEKPAPAPKRARSTSDVSAGEEDKDKESSGAEAGGSDGGAGKRRKKRRGRPPALEKPAGGRKPRTTATAAAAAAAGPSGGLVRDPSAPPGMLSLFVTIEPAAGGNFCFMPVAAGRPVPPGAIQVYFPYSAVPQLRDAAKAQRSIWEAGGGAASGAPPPMNLEAPLPPRQAAAAAASAGAEPAAAGGGAATTPSAQPTPTPSPAVAQAPDTGGKGKKTRAKTDERKEPAKRYKTAWNSWVTAQRSSVAAANPGKSSSEILLLLGEMWREAPPEVRAGYEAEAERAKERYMQAKEERQLLERDEEGGDEREEAGDGEGTTGHARNGGGGGRAKGQGGAKAKDAGAQPAPKPPGPAPQPPAPARNAQQLYTSEFVKALSAAPGLTGPVSQQTALSAAASSWGQVERSVRTKYEEKAAADLKRFQRELASHQLALATHAAATAAYASAQAAAKAGRAAAAAKSKPTAAAPPAAAAAAPAAAAPAAVNGGAAAGAASVSNGVIVDLGDVDEVLNKGLDLGQVQRRFFEMGWLHEAYMLLVDAWRKECPRIQEVVQLYKSHIHSQPAPDWEAFMERLVGGEKLKTLKGPKSTAKVEAS